jgi:hypothetical protein
MEKLCGNNSVMYTQVHMVFQIHLEWLVQGQGLITLTYTQDAH